MAYKWSGTTRWEMVDCSRRMYIEGFSVSGFFQLSQLILSPRHPASLSAPFFRRMASSVTARSGAALLLLDLF